MQPCVLRFPCLLQGPLAPSACRQMLFSKMTLPLALGTWSFSGRVPPFIAMKCSFSVGHVQACVSVCVGVRVHVVSHPPELRTIVLWQAASPQASGQVAQAVAGTRFL